MLRSHSIRRVAAGLAFALALVASSSANAQDPITRGTSIQLRGAEPGRIRGVVFDSLVMRPVPRAVVTLLGTNKPAIADSKGRFTFDNVPIGERTLLFSSPDIDSLGFGALGATIIVRSREESNAYISTPSLRTLWSRLCAEATTLSTDSGIVWGTIRDAASLQTRPNASAEFRWYDLDSTLVRGLRIHDTRKAVVTGGAGIFFACGVPTSVAITSEAIDSNAASGLLEYSLGERRLLRLDMLVSRDMIVPDSTNLLTLADTMAALNARGMATVRGTILDEKNRPLNNAVISLPSAGTSTRTNGRGQFVLGSLPAGTHMLEIRRLGYAKRTHLVSLRANAVTVVALEIAGLNMLSTYNVRANGSKGSDRQAFEARRALGTGMFLEGRDLASRRRMEDVLRTFPRTTLQYDSTGAYRMSISVAGLYTHCAPLVFVDDMLSSIDVIALYKPQDFRAVEVYNRLSIMPEKYRRFPEKEFPCAVMLFWSKSARW